MQYDVNKQENKKTPSRSEFNAIIRNTMVDFGIPLHVKGYQYINDALFILIEDDRSPLWITADIYLEIAQKHYTTPIRVERAIRHAIEISWDGFSRSNLTDYFPDNTFRPANSIFLNFIYRWINSMVSSN